MLHHAALVVLERPGPLSPLIATRRPAAAALDEQGPRPAIQMPVPASLGPWTRPAPDGQDGQCGGSQPWTVLDHLRGPVPVRGNLLTEDAGNTV